MIVIYSFFNELPEPENPSHYFNRAIQSIEVVISSMQKLNKEVTGKSILDVLSHEDSIQAIADEIIKKLPDSPEAKMFKQYGKSMEFHYDSCFDIVKPLLPRLQIKNKGSEITV